MALSKREQEDEILVEALAVGRTYAEAGRLADVSERTVRRRMSDPAFARIVSVRRGEHVGVVTGHLVSAGEDAVRVLLECLTDSNAAVRIRSAHLLLTLGAQLRHAHELEERIAALEAQSEDETA